VSLLDFVCAGEEEELRHETQCGLNRQRPSDGAKLSILNICGNERLEGFVMVKVRSHQK